MFLFLALFALALFAVEDVIEVFTKFLIFDICEGGFGDAISVSVHSHLDTFSDK